jgi:hypothetical protein
MLILNNDPDFAGFAYNDCNRVQVTGICPGIALRTISSGAMPIRADESTAGCALCQLQQP